MEKVRLLDTSSKGPGTAHRLVTLEDLELFRQGLLSAFRSLLIQYVSPTSQKKWLKTYEVRKILGISRGTLQTLKKNGVIPFTKIGGLNYYDAEQVNKALEERTKDFIS